MQRRDFLKGLAAAAVLAPVGQLLAKTSETAVAGKSISRKKTATFEVPMLGFGCMRLPRTQSGGIDYTATRKLFDRAMEAGLNYFDTAYFYHGGDSERCVGKLLSAYPRESYFLADKMPLSHLKKASDVKRIFKEQLEKCRTKYFDFYLFHACNAASFRKAERFKTYEFLNQMKQEGKIRRLGFSFHDTPEVLQTIVDSHPWDFAMIQLNYLDWVRYRSKEQYEILTAAGIPVFVMEPLRGGSLATLSPTATAILQQAEPQMNNAEWAFRYLAGLPNVALVLSGMNDMKHLNENIATFSPLTPLNAKQKRTLGRALAAYQNKLAVPCTGCKYCIPCPAEVEIPTIFELYNQYKLENDRKAFDEQYQKLPEDARAQACVKCGRCVKKCPQKIDIPKELAAIAAAVK